MKRCNLTEKWAFLFAGFFLPLTVLADDVLDRFYKNTDSLTADFVQEVATTTGKLIEKSKGHLQIRRPDMFSLEYVEPLEQKYVSNGKTLWIYDAELEQVTIKPLDDGLGDSPALLLSSDKDIRKNYHVEAVSAKKPSEKVALTAKTENMTFARVLLEFNRDVLVEMKMYDNFNQITTLTFTNSEVNIPIADETFHFIPPSGVDIIGQMPK